VILVDASTTTEEKLMEAALEEGAEDIRQEGNNFVVTCDPSSFAGVQEALRKASIATLSAELSHVAKAPMQADNQAQEKVARLMELLDDHDDVQNVYTNLVLSDEAVAAAAGS
jgi:transcriptional/translational regulatory protein YebC/TACO1